MALSRIEKPQWQRYLHRVSAALDAKGVDIEIVGPQVGNVTQARHIFLTGLSYDSKDDVVAVIGEGLEHNIARPPKLATTISFA